MSQLLLFTNNASGTLASALTSSGTTITVVTGEGSAFPAPASGQYAIGTLEDTSGNIEIVFITARTGDNFTVVRGEEGTTALSFASGSRFELRVTAGMLGTFLQKTGSDTLSGTTTVTGVLSLGSAGSIQGGEFTGALRSAAGVTTGQITVQAGVPMSGSNTILTNTNLASNLPSGYGLMQTGMICFWYGASNAIPSGYTLCNGSNNTPDLRDKFILCGGGSLPTSGGSSSTTTSSESPSLAGYSTDGTVLTAAQLPASGWGTTLPFSFINLGQASGGTGTGSVLVTGSSTHSTLPPSGTSSAAHSHGLTTLPAHTHTYTLPPYTALLAIMKT